MQFLSDVYLRCPDCDGKRFRAEVLEVKLARGDGPAKSIADVLELTVSEALAFFAGDREVLDAPAAARRRRPRLPAARPAGAHALRRRGAAAEAGGPPRGNTAAMSPVAGSLFLFDEPTTGLHFDDIAQAAAAPSRLLDARPLAGRDRAQPRRDPRRRLDHRPRARGRRRRRPHRRGRHARRGDARERLAHRPGAAGLRG